MCSHGLYMSGLDYLKNNYPYPHGAGHKFIKVEAELCGVIKAGDKFRVHAFRVLDKYKTIEEIEKELKDNESYN